MGLLTPNDIKDLQSLYTLQVRYLLSTENQILKGLDTMISHASDPQLKDAFQAHKTETEGHVTRLDTIIASLRDGDVDDKKDPIITTLIGSGANIIAESVAGAVRDAGLLATAQKIEHYEIASYGSARTWASILGFDDQAAMLEETLTEEKKADEKLSAIATRANQAAAAFAGAS